MRPCIISRLSFRRPVRRRLEEGLALCDAWIGGTRHAGFLVDFWLARIPVFPALWIDHGVFVPVVVYRTSEAVLGDVPRTHWNERDSGGSNVGGRPWLWVLRVVRGNDVAWSKTRARQRLGHQPLCHRTMGVVWLSSDGGERKGCQNKHVAPVPRVQVRTLRTT